MLLILLIIICLVPIKEEFKCFNQKLFKPLNIGFSKISSSKNTTNYIDTNFIATIDKIKRIIGKIKTEKPTDLFTEYTSFKNNYYSQKGFIVDKNKINNLLDKAFKKINNKIIKNSKLLNYKLCNKYTQCTLKLLDTRIKMIGHNHKGNTVIEGQFLTLYNISSYAILLDFVISDINGLGLHYLKLGGINLVNNFRNSNNNFKFIDGTNPIIYTSQVKNYNKKNRDPEKIYKFSYSCYGRKAVNKSNCENLYYEKTKPSTNIGVWDKKCQKDTECPFFKANKNYPNNFGRCIDGKCEMPLGAIRISPRKIKNKNDIMCHNCKTGTNCCKEQLDRLKYPNLKSPDYMFESDYTIRNQ